MSNSAENGGILPTSATDWCAADDYGDCVTLTDGCAPLQMQQEYRPKRRKYNWEQLQRLESRRRAILKRTELSFWKILTFWDGTCLREMMHDPLIWITIGIYVLIRLQVRFLDVLPRFVMELGNTDIGVIGGFLSFFLVLFVNQSNSRFNTMYKHSMDASGQIGHVASLLNTTFPKFHAIRVIRYMNAAHAASYVGLNDVYTKQEFFDKLNHQYRFLHPQEIERIDQLDMDWGNDACHELIEWCIMDIQRGCKAGYIDAREAGALKEKILQFRDALDGMYDQCDQPVHFFYIHFLCLLSALYLPLFAIDNAYSAGVGDDVHWTLDLTCGLIVALQAIFVEGLRLLGQKMVDPYGDDYEDLSVLKYIRDAWTSSNRILATKFPAEVDPTMEEELDLQKVSIGTAWEVTTLPASSLSSTRPSLRFPRGNSNKGHAMA